MFRFALALFFSACVPMRVAAPNEPLVPTTKRSTFEIVAGSVGLGVLGAGLITGGVITADCADHRFGCKPEGLGQEATSMAGFGLAALGIVMALMVPVYIATSVTK